jgi:hypothetical protein
MSVSAPTTPAPAQTSRRSRLLQWGGVGTLAAVFATSLTIAVWPASEADKARDDGEQMGQAVSALYDAQSAEEVDAALADLETAVADTAYHAGDRVDEQLSDTEDALARAADGFVGAHTTDGWDADVYQAELDLAVDDLAGQGQDIREDAPEVVQAFWDGFDSTLTTA